MSEPDAVAEIVQVDDHVEGGLALLPDVLKRAGVQALVRALLGAVQALEDAAFPLVGLDLDAATDDALTGIGEMVGLRRTDATQITDARYRVALRAWIRALRSSGNVRRRAIQQAAVMTNAATSNDVGPAGRGGAGRGHALNNCGMDRRKS